MEEVVKYLEKFYLSVTNDKSLLKSHLLRKVSISVKCIKSQLDFKNDGAKIILKVYFNVNIIVTLLNYRMHNF